MLTVAFSKRKKRKRGRIVCRVSRAPGARVWTSSNLRHLHSCRRQGSTQECEKVGSQEVEAKHKHKVCRTNLQPRNNSAFIYSYIQPLRAGGAAAGTGRRPALGGMVTGAAERHLNDLNKHIHTQLLICKFPPSLPQLSPRDPHPDNSSRALHDPSGSPHGKFHLTLVGILSLPCLFLIFIFQVQFNGHFGWP